MPEEISILEPYLNLAVSKKNKTASVAYSASGQKYISANVDSDTHLLNISSEQAALALSTISTDYKVNKVVTLIDSIEEKIDASPIILKFIIDHQIRTGTPIEYKILNKSGSVIYSIKNVFDSFPFYKPAQNILSRISKGSSQDYISQIESGENSVSCLKKHTTIAVSRNFPTYDSASSYGSAVLTKNGKIYSAGQYSSYDHRIGFHSEIIAFIAAIMDGNPDIEYLGIASTKYPDTPCNCCGVCRQFMAEMSSKFNLDLKIYGFSLNTDEHEMHQLSEYLPNAWSNKNPKNE